jgi:uncharacterized membrane protein
MKNKIVSTMLLGAAVPVLNGQAAEFIPLGSTSGDSFSVAIDLSSDGSTVLGGFVSDFDSQAFRWNGETGFSLVPMFDPGNGFLPNLTATSISGDGTWVAGYVFTGARTEAAKWSSADGYITLGTLPPEGAGAEYSIAVDISDDGNSVAASGTAPSTPFTSALLWNSMTGFLPLGFLPEDQPDPLSVSFSFAQALSSDGQVVVGSSASTKHADRGDQAFRWTMGEGMQPLGFLPGETQSTATAVSSDGSVVVGLSGLTAFRWTAETGIEAIGSFVPTDVSADGSVVVGTTFDMVPVATIWTASTQAQPLETYLETQFGLQPGWLALNDVVAISADGLNLAGNGINAAGQPEAFVARLGASVQTSGEISLGGPVSLFLVDPENKRYGTNPATGDFHSEIPDLSLSDGSGTRTVEWLNILSGNHQIYLKAGSAGVYEMDLTFVHLDNQPSGASFTGDLLQGGVHIYSAEISAETSSTAQYRLVYSDTDGDQVEDGADSVPRSDLRSTVIIGDIDTGLPNRVLSDGSTLNDIINAEAAKAENHGEFVSAVARITKLWTSGGLLPKEARSLVQSAAAQSDLP